MARETTAIAPLPKMNSGGIVLGGKTFKVVEQVTRTVLKQLDEIPYYLTFESPFHPSTMDPANSEYKDKEGNGILPDVADVLNLESGESQILIGNAVLQSEIERRYPDGAYVGMSFAFKRGRSESGDKRYKTYQIVRIVAGDDGKPEGRDPIDATGADAIDRAKQHKVEKKAS